MAKLGKVRDSTDGLVELPKEYWKNLKADDKVWASNYGKAPMKLRVEDYCGGELELHGQYEKFWLQKGIGSDTVYLKPTSKVLERIMFDNQISLESLQGK